MLGRDRDVAQQERVRERLRDVRKALACAFTANKRPMNARFAADWQLVAAWARRDPNSPLVFHRNGIAIRRWRTACRPASSTSAAAPPPAGPRRQAPRNGASILDAARELGIRDAQDRQAVADARIERPVVASRAGRALVEQVVLPQRVDRLVARGGRQPAGRPIPRPTGWKPGSSVEGRPVPLCTRAGSRVSMRISTHNLIEAVELGALAHVTGRGYQETTLPMPIAASSSAR